MDDAPKNLDDLADKIDAGKTWSEEACKLSGVKEDKKARQRHIDKAKTTKKKYRRRSSLEFGSRLEEFFALSCPNVEELNEKQRKRRLWNFFQSLVEQEIVFPPASLDKKSIFVEICDELTDLDDFEIMTEILGFRKEDASFALKLRLANEHLKKLNDRKRERTL